ncbi:MAG TPA: phosphatase PAP2 family protein [Ureibacillus sp.]|nr:phosphatase PAP2 family protein [Ureibacillus sp.]
MKKVSYILAVFTFVLFIVLLINFEKSPFVKFDQRVSDVFYGNDFLDGFHILGETMVIVVIALILLVVLGLKQRNYKGMLFVLLTIGVGRGWNQVIRNWVDRPRPELASEIVSFSFPSGHAMIGMLYLFTIAYLLSKAYSNSKITMGLWIISIILTLLTGLSRLAASAHYATDVIAGWCIAYTWFVICVAWYERRKNNTNERT